MGMTYTPPQTSTGPTPGQMIEDLLDLGVGLVTLLMPLFLLAVPGFALFVVLPALLLVAVALPLAVVGAVVVLPPYLLVRRLRQPRLRAAIA
ncbi:MAG TPA: hypothetical protein VNS09_22435 [Solirubrobacter sp.]|nr:hypothetical protein [Solirubrobacter sp.]